MKLTGTTRVEDLINQVPQTFGDRGGNVSNGSTGVANINLRKLGVRRTLVLIDGPRSRSRRRVGCPVLGRRHQFHSRRAHHACRHADAVGDIVNFIMDDSVSGFKLDGQYSLFQHDNNLDNKDIRDALNLSDYGFPNGSSANGGQVDVTAVVGGGFDDNRGGAGPLRRLVFPEQLPGL